MQMFQIREITLTLAVVTHRWLSGEAAVWEGWIIEALWNRESMPEQSVPSDCRMIYWVSCYASLNGWFWKVTELCCTGLYMEDGFGAGVVLVLGFGCTWMISCVLVQFITQKSLSKINAPSSCTNMIRQAGGIASYHKQFKKVIWYILKIVCKRMHLCHF